MNIDLYNALIEANFLQNSPVIKNKPHRICMVNSQGKIIKTFKSIEQISFKLKIDINKVRKAANNGTCFAGYLWHWN
jgi:hypothetical protein